MPTKKQLAQQINKLKAKLNGTAFSENRTTKKGTLSVDERTANTLKSEIWFKEKQNLNIVERGFKHSLPTKQSQTGTKEYDAVKFNNGKIGVILNSGFIKYAWDTAKK